MNWNCYTRDEAKLLAIRYNKPLWCDVTTTDETITNESSDILLTVHLNIFILILTNFIH